MANFRFRLKAVATLREQARDRLAEALAEVMEAQRIVKEQINQLQREIEEALKQRHMASIGIVRIDRLLMVQRHQLMLEAQRDQANQQLKLLEEEYDRRRALLVEAEKEVKAMERLKETQKARWDQDQLIAEQKQMDEWASTQYQRLQQ
jgi:flagellar FliJ protein